MLSVSVITPAYNAASTLRRAYQSLCHQDVTAWQHIIVNDGSTDSTRAVAEAMAAADARVSVLNSPNRGPAAAHNLALAQAKGPFIAFLDADDEYLPGHLGKRLKFFQDHPDADIIWGGLEVIADRDEDAYVPDAEKGYGLIHASECMAQGTLMFRRRVIEQFRFNENRSLWSFDYEFMQRATQVFTVRRFPEITYRYYRNTGVSMIDRAKALSFAQIIPAAQSAHP